MAVNDGINNSLTSYGGSIINERVYHYLGSLGYTGSISDRLAKHTFEGKKGWQAIIAEFGKGVVSELDPDAQAYINAVETEDGQALETGVRTAIDDFVVGCKADGIWDALKASCILAGARTLNGALVPLAGTAPTNVNFVSGDYLRKTGLKGDGSTKYLDSNRNNNADPQNSQHLAVYITEQVDPSGVGNYGYLGTSGNISGGSLIGRSGSSARQMVSQSRHGTTFAGGTADAGTGLHGKSRSSSPQFDVRYQGLSATQTSTSQTPFDQVLTVFVQGGSSAFSPNRKSFYSVGESIDLALLDTRVSTLMNAIDGAIT